MSFADGAADEAFRMGLGCCLSMRYPEAQIPPMERAPGLNEDNCCRWMGLYRNLTWTKAYMDSLREEGACVVAGTQAGGQEAPGRIVLPDAQWVICHSRNGVGMAAKGGHNLDWDEAEGTAHVEDIFQVTEQVRSIRENLVTDWKPQIQGNTIRIEGPDCGCVVEIEGAEVKVGCAPEDFSAHGGHHRDVWLIQWEVPGVGQAGVLSAQFKVRGV